MTIWLPSLSWIGGPVGGRLRLFLSQWRRITDDCFVLSVVAHGFIISPSTSPDFPGVLRLKTVPPGNLLAQAKIEKEIVSLLQKCAIVKVDDRPHFSLSPIFVIPKKSGGLHVIEPKAYHCVHPAATLQDGISRGSASPAPQGRLGSHVGSAGCLPACFHPSFLQTPSLFRLQGSGVSVSSTSV